MARCSFCGEKVFITKQGKISLHTTSASGGRRPGGGDQMFASPYEPAKICDGSDPGARP